MKKPGLEDESGGVDLFFLEKTSEICIILSVKISTLFPPSDHNA